MSKFIKSTIALSLALAMSNVIADEQLDMYSTDVPDIELTPQEETALELTQKVQNRNNIPVSEGGNGYIQYVYGAQKATVVCKPLSICDVQLEEGEITQDMHIGDSARWVIEPATVGAGTNFVTEHVIIKPLDVNIKTNLVVTTDRRIYHINLVSTKDKFMPQVSFVYPEKAMSKFLARKRLQQQYYTANTIETTSKNEKEYLGNLDFKYSITGDMTTWYPVRVYNDGIKTIIECPSAMNSNEAPSLIVTKFNKNSKNQEQLINYRLQNNKYIVDGLFYEAELISGVGSNQDKVVIRRTNDE